MPFLDDERSSKEQDVLATLCVTDVDTTLHYVNQWMQRYINLFVIKVFLFIDICIALVEEQKELLLPNSAVVLLEAYFYFCV